MASSRQTLFPVGAVLLAGLLLWSCSAALSPTNTPATIKAAVPTATAAPGQDWNALIGEARKEGVVSVYAIWRPETRDALTQAFKAKYGIEVQFSPFSRGADLLAKVQAEQRAGLYLADVFGAGGGTLISTMKPEGVLGSAAPFLVLPEVTDPKNWSGGKFPYLDDDKTSVSMIASIMPFAVYNTDLIKKGEITTFTDPLKPQYKGKIVINDPTVTGPGYAFLGHLALNVWNVDQTRDYLTKLLVQQEAVIQRDNRTEIEWVARGKFPIGLLPNPDPMAEFLKLGAPVDPVSVEGGIFVTCAAGAFSIPTRLAHPNAARLFINWLLTREGATVFSKGFGNPSSRVDVPTEDFNPVLLLKPGVKFYMDNTKEVLDRQRQLLPITQQIVTEQSK